MYESLWLWSPGMESPSDLAVGSRHTSRPPGPGRAAELAGGEEEEGPKASQPFTLPPPDCSCWDQIPFAEGGSGELKDAPINSLHSHHSQRVRPGFPQQSHMSCSTKQFICGAGTQKQPMPPGRNLEPLGCSLHSPWALCTHPLPPCRVHTSSKAGPPHTAASEQVSPAQSCPLTPQNSRTRQSSKSKVQISPGCSPQGRQIYQAFRQARGCLCNAQD